ncbi:MAG: 3-oxoacyl-ACP reductase FabG [Clostridiales bacterium]|nr:3-oxoacyl-ACP reductase FabG [Clostridiales bacterium]
MRTALITGGSRGIGAAAVLAFAKAGYRVAFFYLKSEDAAQALAAKTGAIPICCDVSDGESARAGCQEALLQLRHIDVLINNAGIAQQMLFTDITDEQWQHMLQTNLSSAFYVTKAVLPQMISQKDGRIVNVSSIWGQAGASCEVHYSASKAGLIGMTKALSKEVAPSGITVNCICPGVIQTDMLSCYDAQTLAQLKEETPVGRLGTPEDIAGALVFLCGDSAGFITGQIIGINGGFGE